MRKSFPGYYRRKSKKELLGLLKDGLIIVDANVLLSLYRYSDESSDLLFKCLQKISDKLWIPHQVALEYHNNRLITMRATKEAYDKVKRDIKTSKDILKNSFQIFNNETSIDTSGWYKSLDSALKKIIVDVEDYYKKQPSRNESNDKILDRISDLFEGKVGKPYTFEELEAVYKVGEVRYAYKLPPGFEDRDKTGIKKYGDLLLWRQMIDKVKNDKIKKQNKAVINTKALKYTFL